MPRIGLIYEDESINIAFQIIAERTLADSVEIEARNGGSWPGIVGVAPNLLQVLSVTHLSTPLDCVFVAFDSNSAEPGFRIERLRNKVGARTYRFGEPVYHAIVRQVETWLLGDPEALNLVAEAQLPPVAQPECLLDPKRHLIQLLANRSRVRYDRSFLRRLFTIANLQNIATRCPDFAVFQRKLMGCQNRQMRLGDLPQP